MPWLDDEESAKKQFLLSPWKTTAYNPRPAGPCAVIVVFWLGGCGELRSARNLLAFTCFSQGLKVLGTSSLPSIGCGRAPEAAVALLAIDPGTSLLGEPLPFFRALPHTEV